MLDNLNLIPRNNVTYTRTGGDVLQRYFRSIQYARLITTYSVAKSTIIPGKHN